MTNTQFYGVDSNKVKSEAKTVQLVTEDTVYHDPMRRGVEAKNLKKRFEQKALSTNTGGSGSTDLTLVPIYVDDEIVDQNRKYTPFLEMIQRRQNQGLTADYNVITDKGTSNFKAEDAALADGGFDATRDSKSIKFAYTVGRVTGPAQASVPGYDFQDAQTTGSGLGGETSVSGQRADNAMRLRVLSAAKSHAEFLEDQLLNADSSSNPNAFDGLITQQGSTNKVNWSSGTDLLPQLEEANEKQFVDGGGRDLVILGSPAAVRLLRTEAYDKGSLQYNSLELRDSGVLPFNVPEAFGISLMTGTAPVIPSQFLNNTNGSQQLWLFDMETIELRVLMDTTYEEMAKTNDSQKFFLKTYATPINRVPERSAFVDGIDVSNA